MDERTKLNLKGVHPNLVEVITTAYDTSPVPFVVTEGVRTAERQKALYAQGRTIRGLVVTTKDGVKNKSNHQVKTDGLGHAVDLYPLKDGKIDLKGVPALEEIAKHIKLVASNLGIPVTWGGDWKRPYDPPHFELKA